MFSLSWAICLQSSVSISETITLNASSGKCLISISFSSFSEVVFFFHAEGQKAFSHLFPLPKSICLFLCIRYSSYISRIWKDSLMYKLSCGAEWYSPLWSPESGAPGGYLLCGSCVSSSCDWAVMAAGSLMCGLTPRIRSCFGGVLGQPAVQNGEGGALQ